ncbi:MAG: TIGR02281 family clan AA aspartic protease [Pseudomonadota bacterium]
METGQIIALIFLVIIGVPMLLQLFAVRGAMRNALMWGVIFGGILLLSSERDSLQSSFLVPQASYDVETVEVFKARDNHFHLTLEINNVPVDFLVDTGASDMVLTQADAARIGLDPDNLAYIYTAYTANGEVAIAPVRLDTVDLGDIRDTNVRASVNGGQMEGSLLGMSYLSRFESIEIRQDRLILTR